jgi:hypothetical protein
MNMRKVITCLMLAAGLPIFGGMLMVRISNPETNAEAMAKHAALIAQTGACRAPEKTVVTATAEGVIEGQRRSMQLNLIPLSTFGTFAIPQQWPAAGTWAIQIVATNPEYKDVATAELVRSNGKTVDWTSLKHYFHRPTETEVIAMLNSQPFPDRASLP